MYGAVHCAGTLELLVQTASGRVVDVVVGSAAVLATDCLWRFAGCSRGEQPPRMSRCVTSGTHSVSIGIARLLNSLASAAIRRDANQNVQRVAVIRFPEQYRLQQYVLIRVPSNAWLSAVVAHPG